MTLSIMTLSIMTQHNDTQYKDTQHNDTQDNRDISDIQHNDTQDNQLRITTPCRYAGCCYAECCVLFIVMDGYRILFIVMLNVIRLSVIKQSVVSPKTIPSMLCLGKGTDIYSYRCLWLGYISLTILESKSIPTISDRNLISFLTLTLVPVL